MNSNTLIQSGITVISFYQAALHCTEQGCLKQPKIEGVVIKPGGATEGLSSVITGTMHFSIISLGKVEHANEGWTLLVFFSSY